MALAQAVSSYTDSGTTEVINGTDGNPQTVPIMTPVYAGPWIYTNASGGKSVCCESSQTLAQAEANRDSWLQAGGTA